MTREEKTKKLAKLLEYERLTKGMTQQEFSEFLGIPRSSLTTYLLGKRLPGARKIKTISKKLKLDIPKLLIKEWKENG